MSETTRNPTGYGENATVLGICTSIGLYLSSMVPDENLSNAIIIAAPIVGKALLTMANNAMGGTLASLLGLQAMKGSKL